jgi:hypothetical protein
MGFLKSKNPYGMRVGFELSSTEYNIVKARKTSLKISKG